MPRIVEIRNAVAPIPPAIGNAHTGFSKMTASVVVLVPVIGAATEA
jgi:hypothetical protein